MVALSYIVAVTSFVYAVVKILLLSSWQLRESLHITVVMASCDRAIPRNTNTTLRH